MTQPEAWGYTLICFEEENTLIPMMFTEPVFSQEALSTFNRTVREAATAMDAEFNHEFTVKIALMGLLQRLVPSIQENYPQEIDFDGIVIGIKLLSSITGLRYSMIKIASSGTVVEQLIAKNLDDAMKMSINNLKLLTNRHCVPTIFTVVETFAVDGGLDENAK